jgi:hypothetical protein
MSKDIYVLANFILDSTNLEPWMCRVPLIELDFNDYVRLQLIQDLHLNYTLSENNTIKVTLYKLTINENKEFSNKRRKIFTDENYNENFISSLGFKKIKSFDYMINKQKQIQYFDNISLMFSYIEHPKITNGKYYIDCPNICIPKNLFKDYII